MVAHGRAHGPPRVTPRVCLVRAPDRVNPYYLYRRASTYPRQLKLSTENSRSLIGASERISSIFGRGFA